MKLIPSKPIEDKIIYIAKSLRNKRGSSTTKNVRRPKRGSRWKSHRSLHNFVNNLMAGIAAYSFFLKKPMLQFERKIDKQLRIA